MRWTRAWSWVAVLSLASMGAVAGGRTSVADDGSSVEIVGMNVVLDVPVTDEVLADLGRHGQVLDVLPQIRGVTLRARASELAGIQALSYVAAADLDAECKFAGGEALPAPDLSDGANLWNLDAINVTDQDDGRTVPYDGAGVYVAVIDTGLPHNWRSYFPEERIATEFARAFAGGGGQAVVISSQPGKWEQDTDGHGTTIASVLLGFAYAGPDTQLPTHFNGVAPKATVIPVMLQGALHDSSGFWESQIAHAIVYVTDLKAGGLLGDAPLVINLSSGDHRPLPLERAAIDYAIAHGAVVVACAGNEAGAGMRYPAAYPEVISVAASGWTRQFPAADPTTYRWILDDLAEDDAAEHFIQPFSSRELAGQDLDVAAPGFPIPVAWTVNGLPAYTFVGGTSQATPHVAGVAALMLQKNPNLVQAQVEAILERSAMPLPAGTVSVRFPYEVHGGPGLGNLPTFDDHDQVSFFDLTTSWAANATGHGLLQADAALAVTPNP